MKPRTSHLRRAWNVWCVLPEVIRMATLLICFVALAWLSG
jgi:hypothetical protein